MGRTTLKEVVKPKVRELVARAEKEAEKELPEILDEGTVHTIDEALSTDSLELRWLIDSDKPVGELRQLKPAIASKYSKRDPLRRLYTGFAGAYLDEQLRLDYEQLHPGGILLDPSTRRPTYATGEHSMQLVEARLHTTANDNWWSIDKGDTHQPFKLTAEGGAVFPLRGRFWAGTEPADYVRLAEAGVKSLVGRAGESITKPFLAKPYARKLYRPVAGFMVVSKKYHLREGRDGKAEVVDDRCYRIQNDPSVLERKIRELFGDGGEDVIKKIRGKVRKRLQGTWSKTTHSVSKKEFIDGCFDSLLLCYLGEYLEQYGIAEVWDLCAMGFPGAGSKYVGHAVLKNDDGSIPVPEGYTVVKENAMGEKSVTAMVGETALLEKEAVGVFPDRPHQPKDALKGLGSNVPIGGCGLEELVRLENERKIMEYGGVFEELSLLNLRVMPRETWNTLFPKHLMQEQNHPAARKSPDSQGLYTSLVAVREGTTRLSEIGSDYEVDFHLANFYLSDKPGKDGVSQRIKFLRLARKAQTGGFGEGEEKAYAAIRRVLLDEWLMEFNGNVGRNIYAMLGAEKGFNPRAVTHSLVSFKGRLADGGDLIDSTSDEDYHRVMANFTNICIQSAQVAGLDSGQYINSKYFQMLCDSYAGNWADSKRIVEQVRAIKPPGGTPDDLVRYNIEFSTVMYQAVVDVAVGHVRDAHIEAQINTHQFNMSMEAEIEKHPEKSPGGLYCYRDSEDKLLIEGRHLSEHLDRTATQLEGNVQARIENPHMGSEAEFMEWLLGERDGLTSGLGDLAAGRVELFRFNHEGLREQVLGLHDPSLPQASGLSGDAIIVHDGRTFIPDGVRELEGEAFTREFFRGMREHISRLDWAVNSDADIFDPERYEHFLNIPPVIRGYMAHLPKPFQMEFPDRNIVLLRRLVGTRKAWAVMKEAADGIRDADYW
jgi:hypothetical protein